MSDTQAQAEDLQNAIRWVGQSKDAETDPERRLGLVMAELALENAAAELARLSRVEQALRAELDGARLSQEVCRDRLSRVAQALREYRAEHGCWGDTRCNLCQRADAALSAFASPEAQPEEGR